MKKQKNTSNILLLGGTSSLAPALINKLLDQGYMLTATYRDINKTQPQSNDLLWIPLDLKSQASILEFLQSISALRFERIIVLIGATSKLEGETGSLERLYSYYEQYISGLHYLIRQAIPHLQEAGNIIVLSSRSASHPSFDAHYAATKGALESLVRSLAPKLSNLQSVICVAPSLIENSEMYLEMSLENVQKHRSRTGNKLLDKEDFARFIFELSPHVTLQVNGRTIPIGSDY